MKTPFTQTRTYQAYRFTWDMTKYVAVFVAIGVIAALLQSAAN